jgi:hypothetical protein
LGCDGAVVLEWRRSDFCGASLQLHYFPGFTLAGVFALLFDQKKGSKQKSKKLALDYD